MFFFFFLRPSWYYNRFQGPVHSRQVELHLHRDCQAILRHREIGTVATHLANSAVTVGTFGSENTEPIQMNQSRYINIVAFKAILYLSVFYTILCYKLTFINIIYKRFFKILYSKHKTSQNPHCLRLNHAANGDLLASMQTCHAMLVIVILSWPDMIESYIHVINSWSWFCKVVRYVVCPGCQASVHGAVGLVSWALLRSKLGLQL